MCHMYEMCFVVVLDLCRLKCGVGENKVENEVDDG